MKKDDLEKIENSNEIKEILSASKSLYKMELSNNPPRSFDSLMNQIAQRDKSSRPWKISPWWMVAACAIGLLVGWTFPFTKSEMGEEMAMNDTICISHKQVDTLFQKNSVQVNEPVVKNQVFRSEIKQQQLSVERVDVVPELSVPTVQQPVSVRAGRSITQEDVPTHLYVCL